MGVPAHPALVVLGRSQAEEGVAVIKEDLLQRRADAEVVDLGDHRPQRDLAEEVHKRLHTERRIQAGRLGD